MPLPSENVGKEKAHMRGLTLLEAIQKFEALFMGVSSASLWPPIFITSLLLPQFMRCFFYFSPKLDSRDRWGDERKTLHGGCLNKLGSIYGERKCR